MTEKSEDDTSSADNQGANSQEQATEGVDQPQEQELGSEEISQAEAEAKFEAGFLSITGDSEEEAPAKPEAVEDEPKSDGDSAKGDEPAGEATEGVDPPDGDEPKKPEPTQADQSRQFSKRLRKLEGKLGDLLESANRQVDETDEGTKKREEAEAALKRIEAIEKSVSEFAELDPLKDELLAQRAIIEDLTSQISGNPGSGVTSEEVERRINVAVLDTVHPDWQETTQTSEFEAFAFEGGPPSEEREEYNALLRSGKLEDAGAIEREWEEDFPDWWKDRGHAVFANSHKEVAQLLDRFAEQNRQADEERKQREAREARRANRLRSNVSMPSGGNEPVTGLSDDAAFSKGFKKVHGA